MTLPLDSDVLAATYEMVRATPPFKRWNLPEAEDVKFLIDKHPGRCGWYLNDRGRHQIGISSRCIGHLDSLIRTMAHEMIHLHQRTSNMETGGQHNAAFRKLAASVCRQHGFDPKMF